MFRSVHTFFVLMASVLRQETDSHEINAWDIMFQILWFCCTGVTVSVPVFRQINGFQKKGGPPCQPPLGLFPTILSLNQRTFAPCFDS